VAGKRATAVTQLEISSPTEDGRGDATPGDISLDGTSDVALLNGGRNYLSAGTQCTLGALPLKDRAEGSGGG
jgi:hypothetical protein